MPKGILFIILLSWLHVYALISRVVFSEHTDILLDDEK